MESLAMVGSIEDSWRRTREFLVRRFAIDSDKYRSRMRYRRMASPARAIWPKESVHQSGSKRESKAQTFVAQEIAELSEHQADGHHAVAAPLA